MWTVGKIGVMKYALISVHASVNLGNRRQREEMKFWNSVNEFLRWFGKGRITGDMS